MISREAYKTLTVTVSLIDSAENDHIFIRFERALSDKLDGFAVGPYFWWMTTCSPFKYVKTSPEIIRLAVMCYVRYPLSFRQVEDILYERGIDICHETVRFWWNRFGPISA